MLGLSCGMLIFNCSIQTLSCGMGSLASTGIELLPCIGRSVSLSHWPTRETLQFFLYKQRYKYLPHGVKVFVTLLLLSDRKTQPKLASDETVFIGLYRCEKLRGRDGFRHG